MEAKILLQNNEKLVFLLKGTNPVMANTLRRMIVNEVPTLAIEEVTFSKNSSALYDEMIAHRLGLVPLITNLKEYNLKEECTCKGKGCAKCTVNFSLNITGPCTVYAEEIKFKDPEVKVAYPKLVIAKLLKGQNLECVGFAVLGQGKTHIKFSPGLMFYNYYPKVTIDNNKAKLEKFKEQYPSVIFNDKGEIDENIINKFIEKPSLADACEGICDNLLKIERNESNIIFYLESFGQLKQKEILYSALDMIDIKLDQFKKELKKLK